MHTEQLVNYLDRPEEARQWLKSLGVENLLRAHGNLIGMAKAGLTVDLLTNICAQLGQHLPAISDPDMALNNLERFVEASRNPIALGALIERDEDALPIMLQIFSTSQYLSDLLVRDPESYDLLRLTEGQPFAREILVDDTCNEVASWDDPRAVMAALRRCKHRETLRIAYGDIVRGQHIESVTKQISFVADAICHAAVQSARNALEKKRGVPRRPDGQPARFVVLGLGKLGGTELNYSSDIDLMFLYDADGKTDGERSVANREFFERLARDAFKLLTEPTELGVAYRVDLRLRPEGGAGAIVTSLDSALHYYDMMGRTWERQAFVKARPVAGDLDLGRELLEQLGPWIYRRYLTRTDISEIKALKRRIEQRTRREGGDASNVKTGHGGIRDIEFVIQFLQLLNGGDLEEVRTGNTLEAIARLEAVGCLTFQERTILEESYAFLRKIEHRLQIMFDLQTHTLPDTRAERRKLAIRMGFADTDESSALALFEEEFRSKTELNRKILDHLLHDAFGDEETAPEVDLVLDPDPTLTSIEEILKPFRFKDVAGAYKNLMALATERIPFLSTRRCRHFLAAISAQLLDEIAATPDPDATLVDLSRVSDSLGGKGVLWELFSFNPATLQLYVRLCASSPYLSGILTSNPGMIDELMDSLVVDKLPTLETLEAILAELCHGAEDTAPMLHSFKNSQHLRVGVRDILGKEDIQNTHRALSDIAEACLTHVTAEQYEQLAAKFGEPTIKKGPRAGQRCEFVILAMGKLGGREPNYHSDLDVVFLYEADGATKHRRPDKSTTNQHFFSQLSQRIIKIVTHLGPFGRLYELDPRLRPTGKSGALVVSLDEFARYFAEGQGQPWEVQALCKARAVYGSDAARDRTMNIVRSTIVELGWTSSTAGQIGQMRVRLEENASKGNLKRGVGGTMDVEFAIQMLQLKHALDSPGVLQPGTLDAIAALRDAGRLSGDNADSLSESYRFLRSVEARLRLMNTTARHDMPDSQGELEKLSFLLDYNDSQSLLADTEKYTSANRQLFDRLLKQ